MTTGIVAGSTIVCVRASRSDHNGLLVVGAEYTAEMGIEPGIFADRPFITAVAADGRRVLAHACRFKLKEE